MTNPDIIAAEIVDRVTSIPGMDAALANGFSYHSEALGNREKAIDAMRENQGLLIWDGMIAAEDNGASVYQHDFRIYVRVASMSFAAFLALFHDGIPAAGEGLKMIYNNIPSVAERIELVTASPVVGKDFADYLEIYIQILDRQG
jgi:hypothetical protein